MTAPRLLRSLVAALLPCLAAFAQCEPQWLQGEPIGSLSGSIDDSTTWDPDGAGPAAPLLVVVGTAVATVLAAYMRPTAVYTGLSAGSCESWAAVR
jgi:hypothetical protein